MASLLEPHVRATSPSEDFPDSAAPSLSRRIVPWVLILFAAVMALFSTGFFEADEVTHFLYSRKMWEDWRALLSIWGRFGCTGLYGLAAPWGIVPTRLVAVGVTALVGWGTAIVMRDLLPEEHAGRPWVRRHAVALVWLLLFAQPFFALNSFTVMTEMLLSCTWIWSAVVLVRCRQRPGRGMILAGLVLGLGGLMRPEGWIAVAAWPIFAWCWLRLPAGASAAGGADGAGRGGLRGGQLLRTVLLSTLAAGSASLVWFVLGVYGYRDWLWMIHTFPWGVASPYGRSGMKFLFSMFISMGGWMWLLIALGAWSLYRPRKAPATDDSLPRRAQGRLLLVAPLAGVFLVHGILGSFGLFGSLSVPRYFICISPMAAILAVLGWDALEAKLRATGRGKGVVLLRAAAVALPLVMLLGLVIAGLLPQRKTAVMQRLDVAVAEVKRRLSPQEYQTRLLIGHPYALYALGIPLGMHTDAIMLPGGIEHAPSGTLLVVEQNLWITENRATNAQLEAWGYRSDDAVLAAADAVEKRTGPIDEHKRVRLWIKQ